MSNPFGNTRSAVGQSRAPPGSWERSGGAANLPTSRSMAGSRCREQRPPGILDSSSLEDSERCGGASHRPSMDAYGSQSSATGIPPGDWTYPTPGQWVETRQGRTRSRTRSRGAPRRNAHPGGAFGETQGGKASHQGVQTCQNRSTQSTWRQSPRSHGDRRSPPEAGRMHSRARAHTQRGFNIGQTSTTQIQPPFTQPDQEWHRRGHHCRVGRGDGDGGGDRWSHRATEDSQVLPRQVSTPHSHQDARPMLF